MSVDLSKELRFAIAKAGGQKVIALKMGISEPALSRKLNGELGWKLNELQMLFEIAQLCISNGSKDASDFQLIKEMSKKLSEVMEFVSDLDKGKGMKGDV